jgi:hypothetical protein
MQTEIAVRRGVLTLVLGCKLEVLAKHVPLGSEENILQDLLIFVHELSGNNPECEMSLPNLPEVPTSWYRLRVMTNLLFLDEWGLDNHTTKTFGIDRRELAKSLYMAITAEVQKHGSFERMWKKWTGKNSTELTFDLEESCQLYLRLIKMDLNL